MTESPIQAEPAGVPRRLGAMLYDSLLILALWMATALALVLVNGGEAVEGWWVSLLMLAVLAGYYLYCWLRSGQTLGMQSWRLQLVDMNGNPVTLKAAMIRLLSAPLSILSAGVGYLWFYVGDGKQTWHDRLSKTYVVLLPKAD